MTKARDIEAEFRTPETIRHGVLTLTAPQACAMIRRAEEARVRILGIDAFRLIGGSIQPLLEHSVDYSSRGWLSDSDWYVALAHVTDRAALDLRFEVVLGDAVATPTQG